jgi:HSP20 family protein
MATQEAKTAEQSQSQQKSQSQQGQAQQGQAQQGQAQQGQNQQSMRRDTQQGGMARRGGYDPLSLSLLPAQMFPFSLVNPFSLLRRVTDEMDNAFTQPGSSLASTETVLLPPIEVSERDGNLVIEAELPGLKPENVKVEITSDAVIIEGEQEERREETRGGVYRTERRYGRFYRSIPLPEGTNVEQARARYENGLLEVRIPIAKPQSDRRQLPIEGSSAGSGRESGQSTGKQS